MANNLTTVSSDSITTYKFGKQDIRVYMVDGNPWFVASDIVKALGIQNTTQSVSVLAPCERSMLNIERGGSLLTVSESGMYFLILRCRNAIHAGTPAYNFRMWVTSEVLPEIRKTGAYVAPSLERMMLNKLDIAISKLSASNGQNIAYLRGAIKKHYNLEKYSELPTDKVDECISMLHSLKLPMSSERRREIFHDLLRSVVKANEMLSSIARNHKALTVSLPDDAQKIVPYFVSKGDADSMCDQIIDSHLACLDVARAMGLPDCEKAVNRAFETCIA